MLLIQQLNVRLTSQKSKGNVNQATVKTLTITWKDNQKYEDFIRYHISNEKASLNTLNLNKR